MLIELRVIGEDAEEIKKEVAQLAEALGVVAGDVALTEGAGAHTIVGTAIGDRRG